ncbi:MAG: hypothetical protein B7C24_06475 [Bacteroidetes bacterium 4572_77]|nr:MAG: hypothetical protein B7C24_06475 [Bacteroidetes bacterium 4572_77]
MVVVSFSYGMGIIAIGLSRPFRAQVLASLGYDKAMPCLKIKRPFRAFVFKKHKQHTLAPKTLTYTKNATSNASIP